jgi:predicted ATPase
LALLFSSWQHIFRRELDTMQKYVEEAMVIARHQSFVPLEAIGTILGGWMRAQHGEADAGLALMTRALGKWQAFGARVFIPTFLALIAEIHSDRRNVEAGLKAVDEGLQVCEATGEGLCVPELHRVKGELLANEESLRRAREISVEQSEKALEFRAAISLAAFLASAGKKDAAREILDETRGWFRPEDDRRHVQRADALRAKS